MIQNLKNKLKKSAFIHHTYLRLKRAFNSELLGMTTKTEQQYFARYGAEIYTGKGEIVDLGCWLGSTTIPLIEGLLKNPAFAKSDRKVFAYDLFIWYDWMKYSVVGTDLAGKYKEGDNFVEEFKQRTKKYASRIEIREGDLVEIGWHGAAIEFLLIDAMKNWELSNAIIKDFFVSLVPNESYILHQDYAHYFTPWIHLLQWKFREHFEFVEEVPRSQSVVFKYTKKIPAELLSKTYSFESFSDAEVDQAFAYALNLISQEKLPNVAAAKVMWFVHQKKISKAERELKSFLNQGIALEKDLKTVSELISQKT